MTLPFVSCLHVRNSLINALNRSEVFLSGTIFHLSGFSGIDHSLASQLLVIYLISVSMALAHILLLTNPPPVKSKTSVVS